MVFDSSRIELSESALSRNLLFLQRSVGKNVVISSVVKGNAYGHGIDPFVRIAEKCGVRHFSVFDANEAYRAKQCLAYPDTHIMITGYVGPDAIEWAIENNVSFYVFDRDRFKRAGQAAAQVGKPARIHLELETGMNRTGLTETSAKEMIECAQSNRNSIVVEGICTHFAGAESVANYRRVKDQMAEFSRMNRLFADLGSNEVVRHTAGSAAALSYPETRMDMVRIGIAQYGFWPSKETEMEYMLHKADVTKRHYTDPLRRVLRWTSRVMHVTSVKAGQFVGYGNSYITLRPQRLATVPIGYSHGFRRSLSNLGKVLVRGKRASVVGLVNMSMMLIDVTSIPGVEPGDEVVIIGKQKNARITVSSFSDMASLVNYEMLVRLPSDIPRVVVD